METKETKEINASKALSRTDVCNLARMIAASKEYEDVGHAIKANEKLNNVLKSDENEKYIGYLKKLLVLYREIMSLVQDKYMPMAGIEVRGRYYYRNDDTDLKIL